MIKLFVGAQVELDGGLRGIVRGSLGECNKEFCVDVPSCPTMLTYSENGTPTCDSYPKIIKVNLENDKTVNRWLPPLIQKITIEKYKTVNGKVFDTVDEAILEDFKMTLKEVLIAADVELSNVAFDRIAEPIFNTFVKD